MKRAWFRSDLIGQSAGCSRVHGIPVEQLQLNVYAVIDERIYGILQLRRALVHAALLFNPVPTSAVRAVLVLTNADPLETCVEHPCPPPAVPGQIWSAWKIRINAETILNLRGTLGRNVIGKRFSRVLRSQRARSRNANRKKNHETVPAAAFQGDSIHWLLQPTFADSMRQSFVKQPRYLLPLTFYGSSIGGGFCQHKLPDRTSG